jgi:predicted transposase YdaD
LRAFDVIHENSFINSVAFYLHGVANLTTNEIIIIFTKVSNNLNKIAMTSADQIRLEERENNTLNYVKGLIQNGVSIELISKSFGLSVQKVEEIVQKIKASYNLDM